MSDTAPTTDTTQDAPVDDQAAADAEFMAAVDELFRSQGVDPAEAGEAPPAPGLEAAAPTDADTGTPAPESAPDAAPSSASGDLDQPDPAPPADPTANLIDLGDGLVVDRDDLANLYRWSSELTPEEAARVEQVLRDPTAASGSGHPAPAPGYGQALPGAGGAPYPPQPYPQYQPPVQYPVQPQPQTYTGYPAAGQPGVPVTPQQAAGIPDPRAALGPLAELAPELIDYLAARDAQLAQQAQALEFYQRQQADLAQRAARDEQSRREAQIAAGHEAFKSSHPDLTDVDLHYLAQRAANLQVMAGLVQQHNGDVTAAYQDALTTAMYSDPTYRDRVIQSQVDQFATSQADLQERKANAASLSGSGGSIPRLSQPAPAEMTPDQRRAAMARFVAEAQQQS